MLKQPSGIRLTIDLKKQQHNTGSSLLHNFQNYTLYHYYTIKHLEALAERCSIDQKQSRML